MKIFGGVCLFAAALLLPTNASAGGSIIALKASDTYRSVIYLGEPAKCEGESCGAEVASQEDVEREIVTLDSVALAAMPVVTMDSVARAATPVEPKAPPVAFDEKTASVSTDDEGDNGSEEIFSLEDLRPGNQDMTP